MAILRVGRGAELALTIDTLLEGTHFDLKNITPRMAGRKAMSVNLSDIAAVAMIPTYAVVSVALPRTASMNTAKGL